MDSITLNDIINHPEFDSSKQLSPKILCRMEGRVVLDKNSTNILYLLAKMLGDDLKNYVELGVQHGGTMCLVAMGASPNTNLYGVDWFDGYYKKFPIDPDSRVEITPQVASRNVGLFNKNNNKVEFVKGTTYDSNTVDLITEKTEKNIGMLFIDDSFTKQSTTDNFKNYGKFVHQGGFIIFDNYGHPDFPDVKKTIDKMPFNGWNVIGQYRQLFIIQKLGMRGVQPTRKVEKDPEEVTLDDINTVETLKTSTPKSTEETPKKPQKTTKPRGKKGRPKGSKNKPKFIKIKK